MTDFRTERDSLWKLIDDAHDERNRTESNKLFHEAEQLAQQLHEVEPHDAEHCYAIALTYYHRWDTPHERRKCIEWFRKTEERDTKHPWVPLYLGYQFYDDKHYLDAYIQFDRVNQEYFSNRELEWRNIKTDELKIVSLILGGADKVAFLDLVRLADRYAAVEAIDQPTPIEIVTILAVSANRERFDASPEKVAWEVCRIIRACDCIDVFPEEFAALHSVAMVID